MTGTFIAFNHSRSGGKGPAFVHYAAEHVELLGRESALQHLHTAWERETSNVFVLHAPVGTGKTALIQVWLEQCRVAGWKGAAAIYGWSFPETPTPQALQAGVDCFLDDALEWFEGGIADYKNRLSKLNALLKRAQRQRTLLIIENFPDSLLHTDSAELAETRHIMGTLLNRLAAYNPGLCCIVTNKPLTTAVLLQNHVEQYALADLSLEDSVEVLIHHGVEAPSEHLRRVASNFACHAQALALLGAFLKHAHEGSTERLHEIPVWLDKEKDKAAFSVRRVLAAFDACLDQELELPLLYLLSLFHKAVPQRGVLVLLQHIQQPWFRRWFKPDDELKILYPLSRISLRDYARIQRKLFRLHLLTSGSASRYVDMHPRTRAYFRARVAELSPRMPAKLKGLLEACEQELPSGVPAGLLQSANLPFTLTLPDIQATLASVRSLGGKLELSVAQKHWYRAAIISYYLCEYHCILGNLSAAVQCARQGVAYAELSRDQASLLQNLQLLTRLLTCTGKSGEAAGFLQRARRMHPRLQWSQAVMPRIASPALS